MNRRNCNERINKANKLKELPCKQHKIITWSVQQFFTTAATISGALDIMETAQKCLLCTAHECWLEQAKIQSTSAYTLHDWDQSSRHMDFIPMTRSPASHSSLMILAVAWMTKHHPNLPFIWEFDADECWTTPWSQEISLVPLFVTTLRSRHCCLT